MPAFVSYIPIATTLVALLFAPVVFRRWKERRSGPHLLWWAAGILLFGVGTFTEAFTTLFGWNEWVFRSWYISGALLGGAPLAQGTVYLMFSRKLANRLSALLILTVVVASTVVILSPINYDAVELHRLTGRVMEWRGARLFSPFINTYAAIFLIGGAAMSAWRFRKDPTARHRFIGNVFIALGAFLPGIGGTATRFGHTEVLYIMEFLGLILIWIGYQYNVKPGAGGAPPLVVREKVGATA
ncbi:MAG TPA: hypothetical protein VLA36_04725 [Longimicrobiales bacterium]|nr:hypothetical protein [Longimicrobiales bacterium]